MKTKMLFIGKSLLWALALYVTCMMVVAWEDMGGTGSKTELVKTGNHEDAAQGTNSSVSTQVSYLIRFVKILF
jgi:hypothetical protein